MADAMSTTYQVYVTREDGHWLADVRGLRGAHTYARTLATLERYVREVIVLAADLDESAAEGLVLELDISTGDGQVDEATAAVRAARTEVAGATERLQRKTTRTALALVQSGWSVRDAAVVLQLSPQRVSQLTSESPKSTARVRASGRKPAGAEKRQRTVRR